MKLVVKNSTEDLKQTLINNGYEVEEYADDQELIKEVEVEKVVEVEKELPEYLANISNEIDKLVDSKVEEKVAEYLVYKNKYDMVASIFNGESHLETPAEEYEEEE